MLSYTLALLITSAQFCAAQGLPAEDRATILYRPIGSNNETSNTPKECYNIIIDEQGYMWIATSRGLLIYDGTIFHPYRVPSKDQEIVVLSKDGIYIIGYSYAGDIVRINTQTRDAYLLEQNNKWSYNDNNFSYYITTKDTSYFFRMIGNVLSLRKTDFLSDNTNFSSKLNEPNRFSQEMAYKLFSSIVVDKYNIKDTLLKRLLLTELIKPIRYINLFDSSLSVGCSIYQQTQTGPQKIFEDETKLKTGNSIRCYLIDGKAIWISWANGGISYINNYEQFIVHKKYVDIDFTKNMWVGSIAKDQQGNIIIATLQNGLFIFPKEHTKETYYSLDDKKKYFSSDVHFIGFQGSETYIGYKLPVVDVIHKDASTTRYWGDTVKNKNSVKLFYKSGGQIPFLLSDRVYTTHHSSNILQLVNEKAIKDAYVIGTTVYAKYKYTDYFVASLNTQDTLYNHAPVLSTSFCQGNEPGKYYWGTTRGLYLDTQKISGALANERIIQVRNYGKHILIGTTNGLWCIADPRHPLNASKIENLGNCFCVQLGWDGGKYYYLLTENTLEQIDTGTLIHQTLYNNNELSDGMTMNCFGINKSSIYIGTTKGIILINALAITTAIPIHIINTDSTHSNMLSETTIVKYNKNLQLNFHIDILNYVNQNHEIYWWIEDQNGEKMRQPNKINSPEISIAERNPGTYNIVVQVINNQEGGISIAKHKLVIVALWWQTTWFSIIATILTLTMLSLTVYFIQNYYQQKAKQKIEDEIRLYELESKSILAQLKPHFIFNVLTPLQNFFLNNDKKGGLEYLNQFSRLIRMLLNGIRDKDILIENEVAFLNNYLAVQQKRFSNCFSYKIDVDKNIEADKVVIPTMLLQPIVENAVEHGMVKERNDGEIIITITKNDNRIIIRIEDNGRGLPDNWIQKPNHALQIIEEHIQLIQRKTGIGSISINKPLDKSGTIFEIILPYQFASIKNA